MANDPDEIPEWAQQVEADKREAKAAEAARARAIAGPSRPRTATKSDAEGSYARAALQREREAVAQANKGERERTVNAALLSLGRHIEAGKLDEHEVRREIESACYVNHFIQDDYGGSAERFWQRKGNRSLADGKSKGARDYTGVGTQTAPDPNVVEVTAEEFAGGTRKRRRKTRTPEPEQDSTRKVIMRRMSGVKSAAPQWVWEMDGIGCIQLGTLATLAGRPAAGKSTAARWLAARITQGDLPGIWHGHPMNVAVCFFEEDNEYMVKPSLVAAQADLSRVLFPEIHVDDGSMDGIKAIRDEQKLTEALVDNDIRALFIDPVMSVIGGQVDSFKSNEVRPYLDPFVRIAKAINGIVVTVAHFTKGSNRDILASINGSSAFGEVPRAVIGFMQKAPGDPERVMQQVKNSAGPLHVPMTYKLVEESVRLDDGLTSNMTAFNLVGPSEVSLEDIVDGNVEGDDGTTEISRATKWLENYLRMEQPASIGQAKHDAKSQADISPRTLGRAARKLGVTNISAPTPDKPHRQCWVLPGYNDWQTKGR